MDSIFAQFRQLTPFICEQISNVQARNGSMDELTLDLHKQLVVLNPASHHVGRCWSPK